MLYYDTKVSGFKDHKTGVYRHSFEVVCYPVGSDGEDARYVCTCGSWEAANRTAQKMNGIENSSYRPDRIDAHLKLVA